MGKLKLPIDNVNPVKANSTVFTVPDFSPTAPAITLVPVKELRSPRTVMSSVFAVAGPQVSPVKSWLCTVTFALSLPTGASRIATMLSDVANGWPAFSTEQFDL